MLNREDVERITENVLSQLSIVVKSSDFTDPNTRIVELKFKGKVISWDRFDVVQQREYEG
jgi:hypothetical protein